MVWVPWPTVSSKVLVSVPVAFVAERVTELEPTAVGVPEITPVAVLIDKPEELTQKHLDETILDGRKIGRKEFERLCDESLNDSAELSNAYLGTRIIHKVDYDESWANR